ncbi:DUF2997 domain-containing protein [uncultured Microbacterium sp.]|uniref:DUF2997 domain-containing protein n=1 Tax=uncultured Microbacterium sp. TaxID=191216 RepID=UPI003459DE65
MVRRLTVSILPDGTINAEASGTPGPNCLSAIDQLRQILHAEVADSKPTPEFSGSVPRAKLNLEADSRLEDRA